MNTFIKTLVALIAFTIPIAFASQSKAALGWTWDECQQHWGEPLSSKELSNGLFTATFEAQNLVIWV
jgi:hypothetical protein